ncbi:MAG TPA: T9SS type A sorting domain-containing protein [Puia sp.]|jgi:hypothetical protein|nr:T9SS type A sorting domain-containing protein [Puia sp.]
MEKIYPIGIARPILSVFCLLLFSFCGFAQVQSVYATGLDHPSSVFIDKSGRLFFTNGNNVQTSQGVFAGTGTAGSSGDGGPATSAQLNQPYGIFEDPDGNVYIGTRGDNKIRKVATDGTISTFAGNGTAGYSGDGGPATQASLAGINGLCGDPYGNIYVSDSIHAVVRKIDTTGKITTIAGTGISGYSGDGGPATAAQLFSPNGIGMDANRNLYIGDDSVNAVRKIDTNGIITTVVGGNTTKGYLDGAPLQATFSNITNIAVDDNGDVYIIDNGNQLLRVFSSPGLVSGFNTALIEQPGTQPFTAITVGPTGQPYASDTTDGDVWSLGIWYNPGADSVSQDIYAPLPGHPLTGNYGTYIVDNLGFFTFVGNRTIQLSPTSALPLAPNMQLPSGQYTFVVSMDSFFRFNGIDLSNRHVRIIAPPGQDSVQDQVTIWFTEQDAYSLAGYMTSVGDADPGFIQYLPVGPQESYMDLTPLRILYFHGADNRPGNVTGPVEEIVPSWGMDDAYDPFGDPYNVGSPGDLNYNSDFAISFPVSHGLAGNIYFTTGTLGPLPLTLLSFTAAPQGRDAVLNWTTTNEVDTKDFLVERSTDTASFAVVGSVDAAGASGAGGGSGASGSGGTGGGSGAGGGTGGGSHSYGYTDKDLAPGSYYYRLQMEDHSGKYTYSPIRSVTIGAPALGGFVLYPNPAKDVLYCEVPVTVGGRYIVQLTDRDGGVLQTQQVSLSPGMTTLSFDVSGLAAGVYFITVSAGSHKQTGSFMK